MPPTHRQRGPAANPVHSTPRRARHILGAFALAAASLPGQGRVWIVDAANGAGTDFTTLGAAVTAAADGDQIQVRRGTYFAVSTSKALTILGATGASFANSAFDISGLPAGRDFVLKGFFSDSIVKPQIRVRNCAGRVLLDRIRLSPFPGQATFGAAIAIENCALVTLADVTATAHPAVLATNSAVQVTDCDLVGGDGSVMFPTTPAFAGIDCSGTRLELTNSRLTGGAGARGSGIQFVLPSPALTANNSVLRISSAANQGVLRAGAGTAFVMSALRGDGGSLRLDPNVVLTPTGGATPYTGTISVQTLRLPAIQALGAPPGGVLQVDLSSAPDDLAAMLMSPPANLTPLPMFGGDLGLDPVSMVPVLTTTLGPTGRVTLAVSVPNAPSLRGSSWVSQGLAGTPARGFLLSNSSRYTID